MVLEERFGRSPKHQDLSSEDHESLTFKLKMGTYLTGNSKPLSYFGPSFTRWRPFERLKRPTFEKVFLNEIF